MRVDDLIQRLHVAGIKRIGVVAGLVAGKDEIAAVDAEVRIEEYKEEYKENYEQTVHRS
jgi:hypothetical protein